MILKTVAYVSRGTFLETFLKQEYLYESFCYLNEKIGFLARKIYAGLSKAHFTCPEQHFEKKMIEVNFSVCGFFKSLRDFFFTDKKLALGVKTTTQAYRAKNYRKIFCRKCFFESISRIEQRNLEIKLKITGWIVETTFNGSGGTRSQQHFWSKSKIISTFPD